MKGLIGFIIIAAIAIVAYSAWIKSGVSQAEAKCEIAAIHLYHERGEPADGLYVEACMRAAGYRQDTANPKCQADIRSANLSLEETDRDPECYVGDGWLSHF